MALGSNVDINIVTSTPTKEMDALFSDLWIAIFNFEKRFSRFLPDSELSAFNRSAGIKQQISPEFRDLLLTAKSLSQKTGGLYNPFILPALQRAGYMHSAVPGYEGDAVDDFSNNQVVAHDQLEVGDTWARIPYGTALDMGGCGKGYLADELRPLLNVPGILGYWVSMGGDVMTYGHDAEGKTWKIDVQSAVDTSKASDWYIECPSSHFAIATSGTFRRPSQSAKKDWHHIIDPRTLQSAETDVRLATICMDSSVQADVVASCAVILGSKKAGAFLKQQNVDAYMLQAQRASKYFVQKNGAVFHQKARVVKVAHHA